MAYSGSADKAVLYLAERVLDDEWVAAHDDIAYYFKAPMAFVEAGRLEDAGRVLDVAAKYIESGGAGSGIAALSSQFPHYPWMWMCWAATRLGREELARVCFEKVSTYVHPSSGSGLAIAPYHEGAAFEADFFATAEVVKVALLQGRSDVAEASADMLLWVLQTNRSNMMEGRFQLRWTGLSSADFALMADADPLHCVLQGQPGQLYFMMAFPAMVLLELAHLANESKAATYRAGASELLDYLKRCAGVLESPWSHKFGRAAAMAGDKDTAISICDFFLSRQHPIGNYQDDPEAMDSVDQTAELAVWLRQIQQDLA